MHWKGSNEPPCHSRFRVWADFTYPGPYAVDRISYTRALTSHQVEHTQNNDLKLMITGQGPFIIPSIAYRSNSIGGLFRCFDMILHAPGDKIRVSPVRSIPTENSTWLSAKQ